MIRRISSYLVAAGACLLLCAGIIRHDVSEAAYAALALEKQFDAVGQVWIDTAATGSCVLIRDRYVLSAAHVFIAGDYREETNLFNGSPMTTFIPYNERAVHPERVTITFNGKPYKVKKIILHPAYLDPKTPGVCDLAILELVSPVTDITPARINKQQDELHANVIGVGFGVSGIANDPASVQSFNKKIAGQNVIDSLDGYAYIGNHTLLYADFDHPTNATCNKTGSATPRPLEYICGGGDSGGGLFRQVNDQWELVGICAGGNTNLETLLKTGYYGQVMSWTRVSVFDSWLTNNARG